MKTLTVRSQFHHSSGIFIPTPKAYRSSTLHLKAPCSSGSRLARISVRLSGSREIEKASETGCITKNSRSTTVDETLRKPIMEEVASSAIGNGYLSVRSMMISGAVFVGVMLLTVGLDNGKALAFGPEGPLVEEFWENVRRYALYALTVSTGVLWAGLQPIVELLKNPITAVLIIIIIVGSIYILSQVLSLMVGTTDFFYQYEY